MRSGTRSSSAAAGSSAGSWSTRLARTRRRVHARAVHVHRLDPAVQRVRIEPLREGIGLVDGEHVARARLGVQQVDEARLGAGRQVQEWQRLLRRRQAVRQPVGVLASLRLDAGQRAGCAWRSPEPLQRRALAPLHIQRSLRMASTTSAHHALIDHQVTPASCTRTTSPIDRRPFSALPIARRGHLRSASSQTSELRISRSG